MTDEALDGLATTLRVLLDEGFEDDRRWPVAGHPAPDTKKLAALRKKPPLPAFPPLPPGDPKKLAAFQAAVRKKYGSLAKVNWSAVTSAEDLSLPTASLRIGVRSAGRRPPKRTNSVHGTRVVEGGVKAQRAYRAAGAYIMQVRGKATELVLFLVAHLLTQAEMVCVRRCERPGCDHFVVVALEKRGARQRFCSAKCRVWNAELEQRKNKR